MKIYIIIFRRKRTISGRNLTTITFRSHQIIESQQAPPLVVRRMGVLLDNVSIPHKHVNEIVFISHEIYTSIILIFFLERRNDFVIIHLLFYECVVRRVELEDRLCWRVVLDDLASK
jgi:hypothetical protein